MLRSGCDQWPCCCFRLLMPVMRSARIDRITIYFQVMCKYSIASKPCKFYQSIQMLMLYLPIALTHLTSVCAPVERECLQHPQLHRPRRQRVCGCVCVFLFVQMREISGQPVTSSFCYEPNRRTAGQRVNDIWRRMERYVLCDF